MIEQLVAELILLAADLAADAIRGKLPNPATLLPKLFGMALSVAPKEELMKHLDQADADRIDREVDAEEAAKVGS